MHFARDREAARAAAGNSRRLPCGCPSPPGGADRPRLCREGFDAVVFIVIHYLALGTLLNAYDVPAGRPVAQLP
jgi:hypothetical protein